MTFDDLPSHLYPHKKQLDSDRFAYILPITFDRARIAVSTFFDCLGVYGFY